MIFWSLLMYGISGVVAVWIEYWWLEFYRDEVLRTRTGEESARCINDGVIRNCIE